MRTRPLCFVCLLFLIIQSIGLMISGKSRCEIPASSIYRGEDKQVVCVQGQVYKKENKSKYQIIYLKNNSVRDFKLMIYDKNFIQISIGQKVEVNGTIGHFDEARNPGNFNQALYYAKQDVYGVIWANSIKIIDNKEHVFLEKLYQFKQLWKSKLLECMDEKQGGILVAMLLGDKEAMNSDVQELYQVNGIGHILAISGLHISFIGLGIYKLLRKSGLGFESAGLIGVSVLTLYVCMIGFTVSVIRAYVMLSFRIGADMCGRVYDMLTALMVAATITVYSQPLYLADEGFWMSYGAIFGLLLVLPALQKCACKRRKWLDGVLASMSVNIVLFPILLWFYFEFPIYSIFLNILVVPLMSWVLALGMIGSLCLVCIPPLGSLCLKGCGLLLLVFERLGEAVSHLPATRWVLGKPSILMICTYYLILIGILFFIYVSKTGKWWAFCTLVIGGLLFCYEPRGNLTVTMLDVGQGDSIFLKGPEGTSYLIDGGSSDVKELGKYRLEPFLKSQGVGKLKYAFVTHGDGDHYSGILEMLGRQSVGVKIENLVFPSNYRQDEKLLELQIIAKHYGTNTLVIEEGEELSEGEFSIQCLQPSSTESELEGNAGSMVLAVTFHDFSMLCTGDVEGEGEELLFSKMQGEKYDVLKVAHHGSKNSSSEALLDMIQPKIALISAGRDNGYGHPHEEVLQRLEKVKSRVFTTQENGAIMLITDGNSLTFGAIPFRL